MVLSFDGVTGSSEPEISFTWEADEDPDSYQVQLEDPGDPGTPLAAFPVDPSDRSGAATLNPVLGGRLVTLQVIAASVSQGDMAAYSNNVVLE